MKNRLVINQYIIWALLMFLTSNINLIYCQSPDLEPCDSNNISTVTTEAPIPPLGFDHLYQEISSHLNLPNSINGITKVRFIVNCRGEIGNFEIIQSIDLLTDNSIISALSQIENWRPGRLLNADIDSVFYLTFNIENGTLKRKN